MDYLSKREQQIMEVLYRVGRATAEDVREALPSPPSNSSIRTLLRILVDKGFAIYDQVDGRYVYSAARPVETQARTALQKVLDTFFNGSVTGAVAALMSDADSKLSPSEIQELESLIDAAKEAQP